MNMSMNETEQSSCQNSASAKIGKTFAYCLIFVVSLAVNTFIGIIVYKTKAMRKPINFLIVNMATSDLLYSLLVFPRLITLLFVDSWLISGSLGQALCKLPIFVADVGVAVSIQSLVLIAVDRFRAVLFPLRSPLISSKLFPFFILATWTVAMAVQSPHLFTYKLVEHQGGFICAQKWEEVFGHVLSYQNYVLTLYVTFLYLPLVLMTIIYSIILVKLRSQSIVGELSANSVNSAKRRVKRERNVLKMAVAIVLGFAVCWLPFSIINLLYFFAWDHNARSSCHVKLYFFSALFLARANCALNPCICFMFSINYRQAFRNLLK